MHKLTLLVLVTSLLTCGDDTPDPPPPPDTTGPGAVTDITATPGSGQITLTWTNPSDPDFADVAIRRSTTGVPSSIADGTEVYVGTGETHIDAELVTDTYYYSFFSRDELGNTTGPHGVITSPLASGTLDDSFGTNGVVIHEGASGATGANDIANGMLLDDAGRIVVVGYSVNTNGDYDMAVWRYQADGTLDPTFGADVNPMDGTPDGFLVHDNAGGGAGYDLAWDVAIDDSGHILIAGTTATSADSAMVIWRLTTAGELDSTFGGTGFVLHDDADGAIYDVGKAIAIDASGRILVAGSVEDGSSGKMALWRCHPDGTLDDTFGGDINPVDGTPDGFVLHDGAAGGTGVDRANGVLVDDQGRILTAGVSSGNGQDMALWRFTASGMLDSTFGGDINPVDGTPDGFVVHHGAAGNASDGATALTMDGSNRIVVTGYSYEDNPSNQDCDVVVWRVDGTGALDTTFGGDINPVDGTPDGFVLHHGAAGAVPSCDFGEALAIDGAHNIVVAGHSSGTQDQDQAVWRFDGDGQLDATFGGDVNPADGTPDGFATHDSAAGGASRDHGHAVAIDATGNIIISGYSNSDAANREMTIWRYR